MNGVLEESAITPTIGRVARGLGVSQRTLRHYESLGLIQPPRDGRGRRRYPNEVQERVGTIVTLRGGGLSLPDIRLVLGAQAGSQQLRLAVSKMEARLADLATAQRQAEATLRLLVRSNDGVGHGEKHLVIRTSGR